MFKYFLRRLLFTMPTLLAVVIIVFFMIRVVPGDIVEIRLAGTGAFVSEEQIQEERQRLGLDQPLYQQFADYLMGLARMDLGTSMWTNRPVSLEIGIRLQLSLQLALMATAVAVILAIPLGILAARYQDSWIDYLIRIVSIAGLATPSFWLGILMLLFLLIYFSWTPPTTFRPLWIDPLHNLSQLIWPALAVGYRYSAVATRMMRSAMLEVVREDYVRTARSKGVWERMVTYKHALRNAIFPVITIIGLEFAFLLGGLVVTEQVFNLNGIGKLFVDAVARRDYMIIQGLMLLMAFTYVVANFVVDIVYGWLDPRITYN